MIEHASAADLRDMLNVFGERDPLSAARIRARVEA
jgi:hypothetical protein